MTKYYITTLVILVVHTAKTIQLYIKPETIKTIKGTLRNKMISTGIGFFAANFSSCVTKNVIEI